MKKILIINNDIDTMELLKMWLEGRGYEAIYTGRQEDVISTVESFEPHVILVDALQKKVAELLKSNPATSGYPILMMTGYTLSHNRTRLAGNDIIEKPLNLNLLEKKIKSLIANDLAE